MKLKQSVKPANVTVPGGIVSIGERGVAVLETDTLPAGVALGEQPILPKRQASNGPAAWLTVCSFLTSRKAERPVFTLATIKAAVSQGLVKRINGVEFEVNGKQYKGDLLLPAKWEAGHAQPGYVGVVPGTSAFKHHRIEAHLVSEAPLPNGEKPEARNKHLVGKIALPGNPKAKAKATVTAGSKAAKPEAKPAKAPLKVAATGKRTLAEATSKMQAATAKAAKPAKK